MLDDFDKELEQRGYRFVCYADDVAIFVGISSKGPWKLSRTFGTQSGLTNQYLKEQGLLSVKELWVAFHYPNG